MRIAAISFIALAGFAASAAAQDAPPAAPAEAPPAAAAEPAPAPAADPAAAPAPAAVDPAAAPPAAPPADTPAAGQPATAAGAPVGSTQSEAQPAPDPAANPTLPTSGDGAAIISVLQNICIPSVKDGSLDARAKAAGMKKGRNGIWTAALGGDKNYTIVLQPQGSNRNVCEAGVRYAVGQEKPIVNALNVWSFLQQPELKLQRNDFVTGSDGVKRVTLSWEYFTDKESTGLVFVQLKKADGAPLNAKYDSATLLYSERKF